MAVTTAENSSEAVPGAAVPLVERAADHGWVWQVSALSIAMGVMLALAVRTTDRLRNSPGSTSRLGVSASFLARYRDRNYRLQQEVVVLRRELSENVTSIQSENGATERLKKELEALKFRSGLSAVEGPGLKVIVRDSTDVPTGPGAPGGDFTEYMVHDQDLNNILTDLKAAGAEHLAISGADPNNLQRVVVTTTARCVGPTAIVNGTPLSAPFRILAIGSPQHLRAALERPDGYVRGVRQLDARKMIEIEDAEKIVLPEYSGAMSPRYARPAAEPEKESG